MTHSLLRNPRPVGTGEVVNGRGVYRAIALIVPKDENKLEGNHFVYLRRPTEDFWVMLDDDSDSFITGVSSDFLVDVKATYILVRVH